MNGLYSDGACGSPASSAACSSVSSRACLEKKISAAASMPTAVSPLTVPYGTLHHLVRTFEWTRLEKKVLSLKLYAPGLGIVREKDMSGGSEKFALVSVHRR